MHFAKWIKNQDFRPKRRSSGRQKTFGAEFWFEILRRRGPDRPGRQTVETGIGSRIIILFTRGQNIGADMSS